MRSATILIAAVAMLALRRPAPGQSPGQARPAPSDVRAIAEQGYIFAYPLVLMELTRRNSIQYQTQGAAEMNHFTHLRQFPDDRFRQVIRPNADTLYSSAWLDLSKEPVLLHVQDTHGRYYLMQLMDAWTETVSVPGKRTTGTGEGWFAIAGPGWKGTLAAHVQRIDCPTDIAWLLGRTQTNGVADYPTVHALQDGYILMPLSRFPDGPEPMKPPAERPDMTGFVRPPEQAQRMSAVEFFTLFAGLLVKNPAHSGDEPMMEQLKRIGIVPGKFDPSALGPEGLKAMEEGAASASARLNSLDGRNGKPGPTGWTGGSGFVGRYGTNYASRAAVARTGLGANPPEDATYLHCHQDAEGKSLEGSNHYRIHFAKDQIPPVKAFWSLTVYDEQGYFTANAIHRFAIGDRDALKFNADGSLDIDLQHASPGEAKASNWLPVPDEPFNISLRLYWPGDAILDGRWTPPPVVREP
ncbi:MAG TPA: DUF1254 domain-containing protein [Bryobacteraceae bacterium]|nr:DUF1254 domain-containing protein [Bryobacteraceae bacterium]